MIDQGYLDDVADGSFGPKTKAAVKDFRVKNGLSEEETADEEMLKLLFGDEYDDGNVLAEGETIKADESFILFYQDEQEEDTEEAANDLAMNVTYMAEFKLAGDEDAEYVLHTIPTDETSISILVEDEIAYVEYKSGDEENLISTLENEKAAAQPVAQSYNNYNDYSDYSDYYDYYDYSDYDDYDAGGYYDYYDDYDPGYDYSEPVENAAQDGDGCIDTGEDGAMVNP